MVVGHPAQHLPVSVVFAGISHGWTQWISWALAQEGCLVTEVRWSPLDRLPEVAAFAAFFNRPGRVLLVLDDWYLRFDTGRTAGWARVLNQVMPQLKETIGAVTVTTRPLPHEAVSLGAVTLRGVGPEEARRRVLSQVGITSGIPHASSALEPRFPEDPPDVTNAPRSNPRFTGREDLLDTLHDMLTSDDGSGSRVVLQGPSGIGKSQTAGEYVRRFAGEYDLIWWVPSPTKAAAREGFAALAQKVGLGTEGQLTGQIEAVHRALARDPHGRWVIVFDGAEDVEGLAPLLPRGRGQVLITAQSSAWIRQGVTPCEVPSFDRAESVAFACRRAPRLTEEQAGQLADRLDDLPLLMDQSAAWIDAHPTADISEYVAALGNESLGPVTVDADQADKAKIARETVWETTLGSLATRWPKVHELLTLLTFFSPDLLPVRLLRSARTSDLSPGIAELARDPGNWNAALRTIAELTSLRVEYDDDPRQDAVLSIVSLRMHRSFHQFVRRGLSSAAAQGLAAATVRVLVAADPGEPGSPHNWARYAVLLPHLETSDVLVAEDDDARQFLLNCVEYLRVRGEYQEGLALSRRLLERWRAVRGETDKAVLVAVNQEIRMLRSLGRHVEAESSCRDVLARLALAEIGGIELLRAKDALGGTLMSRGRYDEAYTLYAEAARQAADWLGERYVPRTLQIRSNLAMALGLQGHYRQSHALHREIYEARVGLLGLQERRTLQSGTHTARMLRMLGAVQEAHSLQRHNAQQLRKALGGDHRDTLLAEHNLALCLRRNGELAEANELMTSVRRRLTRRSGARDPEVLMVTLDHAMLLRALGDQGMARRLVSRTSELYAEQLGTLHPYAVGARNNFALMQLDDGQVDDALRLATQSMEELEQVIGRDHVWLVGCAMNCASAMAAAGDAEGAVEQGRRALERAITLLGAGHVLALNLRAGLAQDLYSLGQTDEAEEMERLALSKLSESYGPHHHQTIYMRSRMRPYWDFEPQPI
ncbi:hypothetical protein SRB5_38210 [Streptomyces sp. RB5]|uniref:Orc1-like AAA ATPase domain-containing protein n=1 Tax=Streptomyces smaragdinus TaxID=2585196 RepID=A0A7K0CJU7_9ACTN|nr:FxSxx-COOH system tetratricopeptide repeat protein [Streptomyces smaragdinus]MQY13671.1 hypothetical protein [Streptomyces smaragdinus]